MPELLKTLPRHARRPPDRLPGRLFGERPDPQQGHQGAERGKSRRGWRAPPPGTIPERMAEAQGRLPALPQQQGGAAEHRSRGDRQVHRRGRVPRSRRPMRRSIDAGIAGRGRGGRADGADGQPTSGRRCSSIASTASRSGSTSWPMRCASRRASRSRTRGRGHPPDRHLPHRRRGERADDRRGPAARHLARAPRAIRACGSACRSGRAASSRRSTSRSTWPRTRSRRRIAVGCPFVMKPASRTPLGAIIMGEVLAETDLPKGAFSILPAHRDGADLFTTDERLKLLSFTGSPGVGWDLKAKAGKKKVVLELGGNAAVIVDQRRRSRRRARADHLRRLLPVGPELHRRAAHPHPRRRLRRVPRHAGREDEDAGRRRSQGPRHLHRPDDRREGGEAARRLDPGGGGGGRDAAVRRQARGRDAGGDPARRRRPRHQAQRRGSVRPGRLPDPVRRFRRGARRGQRLQVRPAGRHLHPRPLQDARRLGPARRRRRRDQRRARATASTTCPMAGSRIAASAAKASASRWRT